MHRFFFNPDQQTGNQIWITGSEARHIKTVLRMRIGNKVELFDGMGSRIAGQITRVGSREVVIRILSHRTESQDTAPLTLVQAMLKGKKMEMLIQKATEPGVHTFIPLITRYCEKQARSERGERWQRIMLEACKQCGRPVPMQIMKPVLLEQLSLPTDCNRIMAWEDEDSRPLTSDLFYDNTPTTLLIGPEGGFHPSEISHCRDLGFNTVSLGSRILRAETAAIATVAIIQHLTHNLDPACQVKKYLKTRATRSSKEKFQQALSEVPDVEPEEHDRF